MLLEVAAGNEAALAFYAAEGFTEIDRRRRYYRDGTDAVVLRLDLGGDASVDQEPAAGHVGGSRAEQEHDQVRERRLRESRQAGRSPGAPVERAHRPGPAHDVHPRARPAPARSRDRCRGFLR